MPIDFEIQQGLRFVFTNLPNLIKIDSQPQKGYDYSVQQLLLPIWTPNDAVLSLLRYIPRCMQQLTMNNI